MCVINRATCLEKSFGNMIRSRLENCFRNWRSKEGDAFLCVCICGCWTFLAGLKRLKMLDLTSLNMKTMVGMDKPRAMSSFLSKRLLNSKNFKTKNKFFRLLDSFEKTDMLLNCCVVFVVEIYEN